MKTRLNYFDGHSVVKLVMKYNFLLVFLPLSIMVGCTTVPEQRPRSAAKVVKPTPSAQTKPQTKKTPPPVAKKPSRGTATYAIDDGKDNIKIEPSVPAFRIDPLAPPVEVRSAVGTETMQAAPAIPAYAVEDARLPSGTSPAVVALLTDADRSRASGNLDAAVVSTERALRIDSRNPTLTYKLAQLRLKQNKPKLAEELAGKAALLAGSNLDLKRKSWLLIAEARRMQQNYQGAKQAQAKAESFFGR